MRYDTPRYMPGDAFLFGPETRGLPTEVLRKFLKHTGYVCQCARKIAV